MYCQEVKSNHRNPLDQQYERDAGDAQDTDKHGIDPVDGDRYADERTEKIDRKQSNKPDDGVQYQLEHNFNRFSQYDENSEHENRDNDDDCRCLKAGHTTHSQAFLVCPLYIYSVTLLYFQKISRLIFSAKAIISSDMKTRL